MACPKGRTDGRAGDADLCERGRVSAARNAGKRRLSVPAASATKGVSLKEANVRRKPSLGVIRGAKRDGRAIEPRRAPVRTPAHVAVPKTGAARRSCRYAEPTDTKTRDGLAVGLTATTEAFNHTTPVARSQRGAAKEGVSGAAAFKPTDPTTRCAATATRYETTTPTFLG